MNIFHIPDSIQDIFDVQVSTIEPGKENLQRTEKWFKDRLGKFTGSENHKLMGCTTSTSKIGWDREDKIIDFNETAKKYVYNKAKERQRKKVLKRSIGKNGEYGTEAEKMVMILLREKYPEYKFEEVGFIEFIEGIAGASGDGLVNYDMAQETKAATNWDALYTRFEIPFDQSHQDFWQIQSEMLALNVNKCLYVIAEPSEHLNEPIITDLSIKVVSSSPIHQQALIHRCMIGFKAIELYLSGVNFHESIRVACTEYGFSGEIKEIPKTTNQIIETQKAIIRANETRQKDINVPF